MRLSRERALAALRTSPVSLRALALRAGLSPGLLSRIAAGGRTLTPSVAVRLAKALRAHAREAELVARTLERYVTTTKEAAE